MKTKIQLYLAIAGTLVLSGCASIPPEAPALSTELGDRISAIEDSHVTLIHLFFDQKRTEIDRFIETEWVPEFAENFFKNEKIAAAWNTLVEEDNKEDRLKFITTLGPSIQEKINAKRLELITPIDALERRIETKIREEYNLARSINNSITSFLLSASKVAENRNRYLEMIGIEDEKVGKVIDQIDVAVSDLLTKSKNLGEKSEAAEEYINKLRDLTSKL